MSENRSFSLIPGRVKAIWTIITIAISVISAIASTAIYINGLVADIHTLKDQVNGMSQQLKQISPVTTRAVDAWNGRETQQCEKGSVMVGARIGANLDGAILCAKVQPALN